MGEKEPNKIEKPLKFKCGGCGKYKQTEYHNTLYYYYERETNKNHIRTVCDETGFVNMGVVDFRSEQQLNWAEQFIKYTELDEDGNEVLPQYCEEEEINELIDHYFGVEEIPQYEVTGSQEKKIAFLRHELGRLSSEEVMNELQEPMPRPTLPRRWDGE